MAIYNIAFNVSQTIIKFQSVKLSSSTWLIISTSTFAIK